MNVFLLFLYFLRGTSSLPYLLAKLVGWLYWISLTKYLLIALLVWRGGSTKQSTFLHWCLIRTVLFTKLQITPVD